MVFASFYWWFLHPLTLGLFYLLSASYKKISRWAAPALNPYPKAGVASALA
jgi:hypothetical protein